MRRLALRSNPRRSSGKHFTHTIKSGRPRRIREARRRSHFRYSSIITRWMMSMEIALLLGGVMCSNYGAMEVKSLTMYMCADVYPTPRAILNKHSPRILNVHATAHSCLSPCRSVAPLALSMIILNLKVHLQRVVLTGETASVTHIEKGRCDGLQNSLSSRLMKAVLVTTHGHYNLLAQQYFGLI